MALFKSMGTMANMAGTMFPGTIVPIFVASPTAQGLRSGSYCSGLLGSKAVIRQLFPAVVLVLIATPAVAQDPQAVMNMLLQRQIQGYQLSHQSQMMRQELERRELQEKLRLNRASDYQIADELTRYCRSGKPPCWRAPPDVLLDEAARRGLIHSSTPSWQTPPGQDCMVIGLGEGDATIDCR